LIQTWLYSAESTVGGGVLNIRKSLQEYSWNFAYYFSCTHLCSKHHRLCTR